MSTTCRCRTFPLGTSPGGTTEMSVTAQTLHLSVGLVTAFHVVRAFVVNGFATRCHARFERIGLFAAAKPLRHGAGGVLALAASSTRSR